MWINVEVNQIWRYVRVRRKDGGLTVNSLCYFWQRFTPQNKYDNNAGKLTHNSDRYYDYTLNRHKLNKHKVRNKIRFFGDGDWLSGWFLDYIFNGTLVQVSSELNRLAIYWTVAKQKLLSPNANHPYSKPRPPFLNLSFRARTTLIKMYCAGNTHTHTVNWICFLATCLIHWLLNSKYR